MGNSNQLGMFFLGLCVAAGMSIGGFFIGQTMLNAKVALNTAEVKGLAERRVEADRANWSIQYSVTGKDRSDIPALYEESEREQEMIIELLKTNGFETDEIEIGVLDYRHHEYRDEDQNLVDQKHSLRGSIGVETDKVRKVSEVRAKINKLIAEGIDIENRAPSYRFTNLNEIKPEMLREATRNARIAANEFAENAGVTVGGIRSARQGNFSVRDAGGLHSDHTKVEKDVRVVTHVTFFLTD
jgi:hypothetical protein